MPTQLVVPERREARVRHDRSHHVTRDHDSQTLGRNELSEHEVVGKMGRERLEAADGGEDLSAYRIRRAEAVSRRPKSRLTSTDGINCSFMNIAPSSDEDVPSGTPAKRTGHDADARFMQWCGDRADVRRV